MKVKVRKWSANIYPFFGYEELKFVPSSVFRSLLIEIYKFSKMNVSNPANNMKY